MAYSAGNSNSFIYRSRIFSYAAAIFVVLIGLLVLIGWQFNVPALKSIYGDITMKPNAALSLILTGVSLWSLPRKNQNVCRIIGEVCAVSAGLIGLLTLSQHIFGWNLQIDQLLFVEAPGALATTSPGRMGITASSGFTMFGITLTLLYQRRAISFAQVLTMSAGFWALLAVIGYTYKAEALFAIARYTGIAFPTAVALFVLCLGILAACVGEGVLSIVCDNTAAGIMTRRLVIVAMAVPFIMGWLRLAGQRSGYFDVGFGTALLVSAIIITFLIAIWRAAVRLRHVEHQRLASEALASEGQEQVKRQAALIDLSYEPIFFWAVDGAILEWNKGSEKLYGYSREEAIGRRSHELLKTQFPTSADNYQNELERVGLWSGELRHKTRDGREVIVESRQQLIESAGVRLVLETNRDITERKRAERDREQLLAQEHVLRADAEKANRVKDEFLATVSHELRTPLNAILGWSTMLSKGRVDETTTARGIEAIERNAKSQAQLVEDLLDVSRIISGNLRLDIKSIGLSSVVKAAMDSVQLAAEAREIKLRMIVDPVADNVKGDAARLQQVIWNLLSNSIKFTPKGGKVTVKVDRNTSFSQITVTDTGDGITSEFLPFVFDRFKQADGSMTRKHSGLGLGLAIARHIIEMHGGTIEANSEGEGRGSIFKVSLPLLAVSTSDALAADSANVTTPDDLPTAMDLIDLLGIRILVVDDEADARDMLRTLLEEFGADVITASSARDALDVLSSPWKPDVLVSDIGMPEDDGYTLIKKVRALSAEQGGRVPAIALTGYVRVEERTRALTEGYQMFVPKPVEVSELATLIAGLIGRPEKSELAKSSLSLNRAL
jgi:PAS domain S-box-containing protein